MSNVRIVAIGLAALCGSLLLQHNRAAAQTYVGEAHPYVEETTDPYAEGGEPQAVDVTSMRSARERPSWMLAYPLAMPVGDFHDYVADVSFRGFSFSAEWPIGGGGLRLGGALDYNLFYDQRPRSTYQLDSGAVTATLYNYADVWSAGFLTRYRFLDTRASVRPFMGLELGATYLSASSLVADFDVSDDQVGFLAVGEVGALTHVGHFTDISVALRYAVTSASFGSHDWPMFMALQLGISLGG